jgi:hypothetical protein
LLTLFKSIFQLEGDAFINDEEKKIVLEMNPKEPELMDKLNKNLCILNMMNSYCLDGRLIQFVVKFGLATKSK